MRGGGARVSVFGLENLCAVMPKKAFYFGPCSRKPFSLLLQLSSVAWDCPDVQPTPEDREGEFSLHSSLCHPEMRAAGLGHAACSPHLCFLKDEWEEVVTPACGLTCPRWSASFWLCLIQTMNQVPASAERGYNQISCGAKWGRKEKETRETVARLSQPFYHEVVLLGGSIVTFFLSPYPGIL